MSRIDERLEVLGIDTSEMTTEEKFTAATGLTHYDEETASNDWYVPGGAANVPSEGSSEGGQQGGGEGGNQGSGEGGNQGSGEGGNQGSQDEPTVETYTAEEAVAYNAALPGAIQEGDEVESDESVPYEYIHDEESWGLSAGNGVLSKYYAENPDEDHWNITENRAGNFNDKTYEVEIGNGVYDFAAHWETDDVQKITNVEDETEVYYLDMFYTLDEEEHELFTDVELTESANKTARFRKVKWNNETCPQCWEGAVNAPGAKLPWAAVMFDTDVNSKLRFNYEGKDSVCPWGDTIFGNAEGHKEWGLASVAKEFNDDTLALVANGGSGLFDGGNFKITLVHDATAEEAIEFNSKLDGAVKAGDPKETQPSEIEVETEP